MSVELQRLVEDVVGRAWGLARQRTGRLAALTVSIPHHTDPAVFAQALSARLVELGLAEVEIEVLQANKPPQLLAVEFERWRA